MATANSAVETPSMSNLHLSTSDDIAFTSENTDTETNRQLAAAAEAITVQKTETTAPEEPPSTVDLVEEDTASDELTSSPRPDETVERVTAVREEDGSNDVYSEENTTTDVLPACPASYTAPACRVQRVGRAALDRRRCMMLNISRYEALEASLLRRIAAARADQQLPTGRPTPSQRSAAASSSPTPRITPAPSVPLRRTKVSPKAVTDEAPVVLKCRATDFGACPYESVPGTRRLRVTSGKSHVSETARSKYFGLGGTRFGEDAEEGSMVADHVEALQDHTSETLDALRLHFQQRPKFAKPEDMGQKGRTITSRGVVRRTRHGM